MPYHMRYFFIRKFVSIFLIIFFTSNHLSFFQPLSRYALRARSTSLSNRTDIERSLKDPMEPILNKVKTSSAGIRVEADRLELDFADKIMFLADEEGDKSIDQLIKAYENKIITFLAGEKGLKNIDPWIKARAAVTLLRFNEEAIALYRDDIITILTDNEILRVADSSKRVLYEEFQLIGQQYLSTAVRVTINYPGLKEPIAILAKDAKELAQILNQNIFEGSAVSCMALPDDKLSFTIRISSDRLIRKIVDITDKNKLESVLSSLVLNKLSFSSSITPLAKSSSAGRIDREKPPMTKEIVINCCENGKYILWKKHRLTPEFARWILKIVAENSHIAGRRPEDVTLGDFRQRIKVLNNRYISAIFEHPDLQEKGKPFNEKRALKNLKLLAGYDPVENSVREPMTKEIIINYCENGKRIQWRKYRLTPEFARWVLRIVAENFSYSIKPEDVTTEAFNLRIKALNNRAIGAIFNHSDLGKKENPFIGYADALKNLKLLAGYKPEIAKSAMTYEEPVDKIISKEAGLEDAAYNQITQLITSMRNGNLIAKERLKKLFNPYFNKTCTTLRYKLYANNYIDDKEWAKKELFQQLDIKYEDLIEKLKIEKLEEDHFVPQIKTFIKTSLTWHYYKFYNKLQKQNLKELLMLNSPIPNGKEDEHFANGKEVMGNILGKQSSPEDILDIVSIIHKLISVMEEKSISAKEISLFFDFHLSGLTQRELSFKYNISRNTPHYTVNQKILKIRHISKLDVYHEFLKEVKSIKEDIDYIPIIEQHPAIREFRNGLRVLTYDRGGTEAMIRFDTDIVARAFASSA